MKQYRKRGKQDPFLVKVTVAINTKKGPQVANENQEAYLTNWKEPDWVGEEEEAF